LCELLVSVAALAFAGGCTPAPEPTPDPIAVWLVNQSSLVVDPNLYAAAGTLTEADLFSGGNLVTSFAEGGLATIPAFGSRSVVLDCDAARTIGVRDPVFSDPVGFSGGGTADQTLILVEGTNYACGQTLVFTYTADGGVFGVSVGFR